MPCAFNVYMSVGKYHTQDNVDAKTTLVIVLYLLHAAGR
jgi:hypothetical protein